MKKILFSVFLFVSLGIEANDSLRIAVISDLHYFSSQLADGEQANRLFEQKTGRNIPIFHEVLDTVIAKIKTFQPHFLLISGDLTQHGERQSHLDLAEKLQPILQAGVHIFVVPGNHERQGRWL